MKKSTVYDDDLLEREREQEAIKASNGLESASVPDRISLSLSKDCKQKFLDYCAKNYITPSAQLRVWISQFCKD